MYYGNGNGFYYSAYGIAVKHGYTGSEEEWLETLKGAPGLSAYHAAQEKGYTGTEEEFNETLANLPVYASDAERYAGEASDSAEASAGSASEASDSAEDSEAYAIGTRAGENVPDDDPAYHNNSKYWSDVAKDYAEDTGGLVTDTVTDYLERTITNPDSPPLDRSLASSSAAAPADLVGDLKYAALIYRANLTSEDDMDDVLEIGSYFKDRNVTVTNGVNSARARVVCFGNNTSYATVQLWIDTDNSRVYFRVMSSPGLGWNPWRNLSLYGGTVTAETNVNSLLEVGRYFKDRNVTAINGVNSARAAIISLGNDSNYAAVQLWFDTDNNQMYYRTMTSSGLGWSAWMRIAEPSATRTLALSEGYAGPASSGKWASSTGNFGLSVAYLKRIATGGAYRCSVEWTPKNKKTVDGQEIFCDQLILMEFDSAGAYITSSYVNPSDGTTSPITSDFTFSKTTKAITFCVYNNGGAAAVPNTEIKLTLYGADEIRDIKLPSFGSNITGTRWYKYGYKVGDYVDNGALKPIYNTGMMLLPPNYSAEGKAVPTIIMVHGSEAYLNKDGAQIAGYEPFYNYLADCGYALIDCYGWTLRYPNSSGLNNPWCMPTTIRAYLSMIDLMFDCFNLDRRNTFIMCKSLGGLMCEWLSASIPLNAAGYLAPALLTNFGYNSSDYRTAMVPDMGLVGTVNADLGWATEQDCLDDFIANFRSWSNDKRLAFYNANESQIMGVSPEFKNLIGKTASECLAYSAAKDTTQRGLWKYANAPTKIWFANDDDAISPASCVTLAQQIRNAGGEGVVRVMPNGTGGHHSVDTDENALQQENVTTPLGYEYESIPLAYYELWQWFEAHRLR